jgi:hypothetical protein
MRSLLRSLSVAFVASYIFLSAHPVRAGEVQVMLGAAGGSSTWARDPTGYTSFKLGYRWADVFAIHALTRLGYAPVNDRSLTYLSLGAQLWGRLGVTRPYVRVATSHQHEDSIASVTNEPAGAVFGVGDGIRHRAGGEAALGIDFPLRRDKRFQWVLSLEGSTIYFPDPRGPSIYVLGGLALGANYAL